MRGTPFAVGVSGNPGGRPKSAEVSALARRYTVDALRGLVAVARLEASKHDSAVVAACKALIDLGYPGHQKAGFADGESANVLHLHLMAVSAAPVQLQQLPQIAQDTSGTVELFGDDMLPQAAAAMPEEALPLWDAWDATHPVPATPAPVDPPIAGNEVHQAPIIGFSEEKASPDGNISDPAKLKEYDDLYRGLRQGVSPGNYRPPVIGFGE